MCSCRNKGGARDKFTITLPGGLKITKTTQAAATAFAAKHPGSTVSKG